VMVTLTSVRCLVQVSCVTVTLTSIRTTRLVVVMALRVTTLLDLISAAVLVGSVVVSVMSTQTTASQVD